MTRRALRPMLCEGRRVPKRGPNQLDVRLGHLLTPHDPSHSTPCDLLDWPYEPDAHRSLIQESTPKRKGALG
jgi:hypothetical protein